MGALFLTICVDRRRLFRDLISGSEDVGTCSIGDASILYRSLQVTFFNGGLINLRYDEDCIVCRHILCYELRMQGSS